MITKTIVGKENHEHRSVIKNAQRDRSYIINLKTKTSVSLKFLKGKNHLLQIILQEKIVEKKGL